MYIHPADLSVSVQRLNFVHIHTYFTDTLYSQTKDYISSNVWSPSSLSLFPSSAVNIQLTSDELQALFSILRQRTITPDSLPITTTSAQQTHQVHIRTCTCVHIHVYIVHYRICKCNVHACTSLIDLDSI